MNITNSSFVWHNSSGSIESDNKSIQFTLAFSIVIVVYKINHGPLLFCRWPCSASACDDLGLLFAVSERIYTEAEACCEHFDIVWRKCQVQASGRAGDRMNASIPPFARKTCVYRAAVLSPRIGWNEPIQFPTVTWHMQTMDTYYVCQVWPCETEVTVIQFINM